MKILALEFSSNQRGIALREGSKVVSRVFSQGQATPVFELISSALAEANWSMQEIDLAAVGLGPGSYTGVRLAIATAQGIVLASGAKCAGVPSYLALADQFPKEAARVTIAIDAQQKEFYTAHYQNNQWSSLTIVTHEEVKKIMDSGGYVTGPDIGHPLFPSAVGLAARAANFQMLPEELQPIYLRQTKFVKAPIPRII